MRTALFALLLSATSAMADKLPLGDISSYLNGLKTAKSAFTQINDDGSISTGTLYIKRPGKMRFEYNAPDSGLVVATNNAVYVMDSKSNQGPETYPLNRTPLAIILARNVDLAGARLVTGHDYDGTATIVTARDPETPEHGTIEMKFTNNPVELRQWVIFDANGGQTTVVLRALEAGGALPNSLFRTPSPSSDR